MAIYVVDPDAGDDDDDGINNPWQTFTKVMSFDQNTGFSPDDQIQVKDDSTVPRTDISTFWFQNSDGTSGHPIKITRTGDGTNQPILNMKFDQNYTASYITIEDVNIDGTGLSGYAIDYVNSQNTWMYDWEFIDVTITNFPYTANFVRIDGLLVDGLVHEDATSSGITVGGTSSYQCTNGIIRNCTINCQGTGADGISLHEGAGASDLVGANWLIYNNDIRDCNENCFDCTAGNDILFFNNYCTDSGIVELHTDHSAYDIHMFGNYVDVERDGVYVGVPGVKVYDNFIVGKTGHRWLVSIDDANVRETDLDGIFENNTFVFASGGTGFCRWEKNGIGGGYANTFTNFEFRNNIFTSSTTTIGPVFVFTELNGTSHDLDWDNSGTETFIVDHNIIHDPTGTPTYVCDAQDNTNINWATYVAEWTDEMQGDPGLVDRTNPSESNLAIASTESLAYHAGVAITTGTYYDLTGSATTGLDNDYNDDAFNSPPSVGAVEFDSESPPPSGGGYVYAKNLMLKNVIFTVS